MRLAVGFGRRSALLHACSGGGRAWPVPVRVTACALGGSGPRPRHGRRRSSRCQGRLVGRPRRLRGSPGVRWRWRPCHAPLRCCCPVSHFANRPHGLGGGGSTASAVAAAPWAGRCGCRGVLLVGGAGRGAAAKRRRCGRRQLGHWPRFWGANGQGGRALARADGGWGAQAACWGDAPCGGAAGVTVPRCHQPLGCVILSTRSRCGGSLLVSARDGPHVW